MKQPNLRMGMETATVVLLLTILVSGAVLASPPALQLETAQNLYYLEDRVKIGLSLHNPERQVGMGALFLRFESADNIYTQFHNQYWSFDGFYAIPKAVYPFGMQPYQHYAGMNCTRNSAEPCFLLFPAASLGPGSYQFSALLADQLNLTAAEFENNPRRSFIDFAIASPAVPVNESTLGGVWNYTARHAEGATVTGVRTFDLNGTFQSMAEISTTSERIESIGRWRFNSDTLEITYQYDQIWVITPDGRREPGTAGAIAGGVIRSDPERFVVVQNNNWIHTFTR